MDKRLILLLLTVCLAATDVHGSLITNGSFESACINPSTSYRVLFPGSDCITGWSVIAADIHYVGTFWQASDGVRSLDLDGNPGSAGGIAQAFATVPGEQYLVSFDLAGNPADLPVIKTMRVSADGQFQDFVFDITGKSFTDMGWTPQTWLFVADDSSATLAFNSLDVISGWGPALDNVSVVPSSSVVPEPSTSVLLGTGVAVLVMLCRRRRAVA